MPKKTPIQRLQWMVDNTYMAPEIRKELASIVYDLETAEMLPKVLAEADAYMAAHPELDGRRRALRSSSVNE